MNNYQEKIIDISFTSSNSPTLPSLSSSSLLSLSPNLILSKLNIQNCLSSDSLNQSLLDIDNNSILSSSLSSIKDVVLPHTIKIESEDQTTSTSKKESTIVLNDIINSSKKLINNTIDEKKNIELEKIENDIKENNDSETQKNFINKNNTKENLNNEKTDFSTTKTKNEPYTINENQNEIQNYETLLNDLINKSENKSSEGGFIKNFIDSTLYEYGTCSPLEREIIEKLLMYQVPLLKKYEGIITNIESFIEKIIFDINKNKSREQNLVSNIENLKSELNKSNKTITELNNKYQNLKQYSQDISKENDSLNETSKKLVKENNESKQLFKKIEKQNNEFKEEIEKYKKYIKELRKNKKLDEKVNNKKKESENEKNKEELDKKEKTKEEEREKLLIEIEKVRVEEKKRLNEEIQRVKESKDQEYIEEINRIKEELKKKKDEEIEQIKEEKEIKLQEERVKMKEEIEQIKEEKEIKLQEEIKKMRKEERGKIKEEIEKMREEERQKLEEERKIMKKGKNQIFENQENDLSLENASEETIKEIENDIIKITKNTSNIIKRAILLYDYLFKNNLNIPTNSEIKNETNPKSIEDDEEIKKIRHVYKSITKKFQVSLEKEITKITRIREKYVEKVEEQKNEIMKLHQREKEILATTNSEQQRMIREQQQEHQEQLQQIIQQLKQEITDIQNSTLEKWSENEILTKLEESIKKYYEIESESDEVTISYELKLPGKTYYVIKKDTKEDLESCILYLNSINESETTKNIKTIFPSLKQFYQEVKSLNRILKIKEDLFKSDKLDDQQIIDNNMQSINKLKEELIMTKNILEETEKKCNKLKDEKNKVLEELENTTIHVEQLEDNINKKKNDLKEFLTEHNTLVNLYNTVVEEEKRKYNMLEDDYNFLKNHQIEYEKKMKILKEENSSLLFELDREKKNSKHRKNSKYDFYNY